jgi:hypothetical protein
MTGWTSEDKEMLRREMEALRQRAGQQNPVQARALAQLKRLLGLLEEGRAPSEEELSNCLKALAEEYGQRRVIRTLDGGVRAILADRYRPLDNVDKEKER